MSLKSFTKLIDKKLEGYPCTIKESLTYINKNQNVVRIFKTTLKGISFRIYNIYRKTLYFFMGLQIDFEKNLKICQYFFNAQLHHVITYDDAQRGLVPLLSPFSEE